MLFWQAAHFLCLVGWRHPDPFCVLGMSLQSRCLFSKWRSLRLACVSVALATLLAGCAAPVKKVEAPALTGALIVVRLQNRLEFPPAVAVEVGSEADGSLSAVTGRRQQSIPGRYADYLLALALPPQRYSITAMRAIGKTAEEPSELLASMMIPFDVRASNPAYLGRLVIAPEPVNNVVNIDVQDHFDEDVLLFRSALAPLRTATIDKSVIPSSALASVKVSARREEKAHPVQLGVDAVNSEALNLLAPRAQPAFTRFLALKLPRAFAVNNAGGSASGSGEGAMERAMRDCARPAGDKSCRIFAVDNTLVTQAACSPATEGRTSQASPLPVCPMQPPKLP